MQSVSRSQLNKELLLPLTRVDDFWNTFVCFLKRPEEAHKGRLVPKIAFLDRVASNARMKV
jgi:hypothetical protein